MAFWISKNFKERETLANETETIDCVINICNACEYYIIIIFNFDSSHRDVIYDLSENQKKSTIAVITDGSSIFADASLVQ